MQTLNRLLDQFVPDYYNLSIVLNRIERTFKGTLTMHGISQPGAKDIIAHSKDLSIQSVTFDGKNAEFSTAENDELHISHNDFAPGEHTIVITYDGVITDAMHGLYPCYYEHNGEKKELLATQFESHHAREVFPCIDEPAAKATFDITLTTENDITVLGNMPIKQQRVENGQLVTSFEQTPRMSSYLLAWVVGEMHKKTAKTKNGVEVNVWATPAQKPESLDFALDIAVRSIEFYNDYFGTAYPLPKSDHVALPDFSSGAMENWGLITYREIALLVDPASTSLSSKQYIATVIAHELAHQWFGNLVTMKWWNNLWLNESFANMMEYFAIDHLHPEWNIWLDFSTNEVIMALRRDSIEGVQSVQTDVHHPDEISTLFDGAIVYAKGGRLLRMLQYFIGEEAFQQGLKQYFKDHAYNNTEADDLWNAMSKASGKDIVSLMDTWISQSGYPVVHITIDGDTVRLLQEQFFIGPHTASDKLWPIPLNANDSTFPTILDTHEIKLPYNNTQTLRLNVGDTAHFITHYDAFLFEAILSDVHGGDLSPLDKVQFLNEATLLVRGGIMPSHQLIKLVQAYQHETSEPVWNIIALALGELRKFVDTDKEAEKKLRQFTANIAQEQYRRLGWNEVNGESDEDVKLRSLILGLTLYGENEDAIAKAKEIYTASKLEDINPELRPLIISTAVRYGDDVIVDSLLDFYKTTSSAELLQDISVGITSTRIPEKITELLATIKDSNIIRPQDAAHWFVYLVRGRDSRAQAWQWIRDNWQWVIDTFGSDKSYDDYPRYSASALITRQQLQEYKDFFEPMKSIPALERVISMGISEIEGRVELIERDGKDVRRALLDL
jgi:aminopeptidase N